MLTEVRRIFAKLVTLSSNYHHISQSNRITSRLSAPNAKGKIGPPWYLVGHKEESAVLVQKNWDISRRLLKVLLHSACLLWVHSSIQQVGRNCNFNFGFGRSQQVWLQNTLEFEEKCLYKECKYSILLVKVRTLLEWADGLLSKKWSGLGDGMDSGYPLDC